MDERIVLLLKELNGKMRELKTAVCCQSSAGGTIPTIPDYQPLDCNGDSSATLTVVPTVVENIVATTICNVAELAEAIGASGTYNTNAHFISTPSSQFDLDVNVNINTIHSVSYSIIGANGTTAEITINGNTISLPVGYNGHYTAGSVITNNIIVEDTSTASVVFTVITS